MQAPFTSLTFMQPKLASGKIQRKVLKEWSKRDAQELSKSFDRAKL